MLKSVLAAVAAMLVTVTWPVHAYLDPGTGSMIISAIVGVFATLGLAIKTYWYKLVGLFRKTPKQSETVNSETSKTTAAKPDKEA